MHGKEGGARREGEDVAGAERRFSNSFRRERPVLWWATLVGPFVVSGAMLAALWAERGLDFMLKLVGNAAATFFVLGRFAILIAGDKNSGETLARLTHAEAFVLVTWMDLFVALLLIFHGGIIFRLPWVGSRLAAVREDGEFILSMHPWMRRFTFLGLTAFVAVPVAATGSVAGSIFGRLLGLSRVGTLAAIVCGTLLGNGLMLMGSRVVNAIPFFDKDNPMNLVGGLVSVVGVVVLLNLRYRKLKQRWSREGRGAGAHDRANDAA